ncbi:hypothetical protein FHG64_17975 [Antarcticibacterium flavum]|uniref:Uncharacterized protein n=1 Tax=Antarcticibacterium flavum TaxID=2058175 RepID=A0A5B7X8Z7_9FLAO|nr:MULTISPECIES: hypothetical protein [Antarcticibacterium]MCM4160910.1 hypothetical protein [Antarcticibacterium sp. W02-3]QCY71133.1 hypothetical protein FHG64_17975 [Antarcticibacterium flavum]
MRNLVVLLFFFSSISWGQENYNSTHTIHIPSEIREKIFKTLTNNQGYILIKSYQGTENVDNQLLVIQSETGDLFNDGKVISYHCESPDEKYQFIVRIKILIPDVIAVIEPATDYSIAKVYNLVLEK